MTTKLITPAPPPPQSIIKSYRQACQLAVSKVRELSISLEGKGDAERRELLLKCAATSLNSKLVRPHTTCARICAGRPSPSAPDPPCFSQL
jgi:chaperonin GroEL (HSP60 family)